MRTLGLRAEPKSFFWAVSEGSQEKPILVDSGHVEAPSTYSYPEAARYLRTKLLQLIDKEDLSKAGLRTPEMIAGRTESFRERLRTEGVLLEGCAQTGLKVTQGPLGTLSKLLGTKAKPLLESGEYRGIDLEKMPTSKREAILMSVSLLEAENADSHKRKV